LQKLQEQETEFNREELEGEIKKLEEEEDLVKKRSALALESLRNVKQQISNLQEKIRKDRDVLDKLKGTREVESAPPVTTSVSAASGSDDSLTEKPPVLPGLALQPDNDQTLPGEDSDEQLLTEEQLAARREADEKAADALEAERAIVDYEERKRILEKQIALAESQLKTVHDTFDNLDKTLNLRQQELKQKIADDKPPTALLRIQQEIKALYGEAEKIENDIRKRNERIKDLHKHYETLLEAKLERVLEAEQKRNEAEAARKRSIWLESPFHPKNLVRWATTHAPQILLTILGLIVLRFFAHLLAERLTRLITKRGRGTSYERENRAKTLSEAFKDAVSLVIYVGGTLLILEAAGVNIRTLLGGAAVIGLAVAFGAQNLMRDYFYGFMILLEGQYKLDDVITIGDVTGVVEHMTMRMTVLRDLEGRAHFIPNGQIARVTNRTHEWSRAVFDIRVSYKEDVDRVMGILMQLARELRKDPEFESSVVGEPQMLGVDKLDESAIVVKFMIKTQPTKMWPVRRELLRRIKNKFDELGILIPPPHRIKLEREDDKS
jgi:small conductance mechanosensitive channel